MNTPYASLGRRFLALILDSLILFIPCMIGTFIVPVIGGLVVWFFYTPILESSELSATIGKYLMGIQVTDLSGKRISFRSAVVRNLLKFVSFVLFFGFLVALFSDKKQTLHDMLADTLVLYGRSECPVGAAWTSNIKEIFQIKACDSFRGNSVISDLERLQKLKESGALTEEEFQKQKSEILSKT